MRRKRIPRDDRVNTSVPFWRAAFGREGTREHQGAVRARRAYRLPRHRLGVLPGLGQRRFPAGARDLLRYPVICRPRRVEPLDGHHPRPRPACPGAPDPGELAQQLRAPPLVRFPDSQQVANDIGRERGVCLRVQGVERGSAVRRVTDRGWRPVAFVGASDQVGGESEVRQWPWPPGAGRRRACHDSRPARVVGLDLLGRPTICSWHKVRGAGKPVRNRHGPATVTGECAAIHTPLTRSVGKAGGARGSGSQDTGRGCSVLSTRMEQTRMAPVCTHDPGDPAEHAHTDFARS
ncbi:hypothetical protein M2167_001008 [Streptomyces sp. SPB4]|nr:hypothetical protein [Streptomyces sp. SPB4]